MKMLVKMTVVALVCTITGLKAEVTSKKLASAFLDYAAQVSTPTKNSASVFALSDFSKQVSDLLAKNMKTLDIENLQKKISIFAENINKQLTYDKAQNPLLDDEEKLKTGLSTSALAVNNLFSSISEELLVKLTLYFEDLQAKVERNTLTVTQKLEGITLDLNTRLVTSIDSMQLSLALNLQNLESTLLECLEELRVSLNVYNEKVSEKLNQQSVILVNNLSPYGVDMQESLRTKYEAICFQIKKVVEEMQTKALLKASQLKEQVSFFKSSLLGKSYLDLSNAKKVTFVCLTDMSQKTILIKEAVVLYRDTLKKTLVEGLEEMKKMAALYNIQVPTMLLDKNTQEKILSFLKDPLFLADS